MTIFRDIGLHLRRRWEMYALGGAVLLALALGGHRLAGAALWHDELVHLYVAKGILETGWPHLPSGHPYGSATAYNYLLAGTIALLGDGEAAVRAPSVLLSALNVVLVFLLVRRLAGPGTAVVTALLLAVSPWAVAWAREARFYALQQTLYLLLLWIVWSLFEEPSARSMLKKALAAAVVYVAGVLTALHSILFIAPLGLFAVGAGLFDRTRRLRWFLFVVALAVTVAATMGCYYLTLPQADKLVVFKESGLGGQLDDRAADPQRHDRLFYFRYLWENFSVGFWVLSLLGTVWIIAREGRRGWYLALAFWAPVLVLTFGIGYRRYRFMYFAYPFYIALHAYAIVQLTRYVITARASWGRAALAIVIVAFGARLAWSQAGLISRTLVVANGSHETLANSHPQWREPCQYVRARLDGAAVLTTTYLTTLYYVGRADEWYPSREMIWEYIESGSMGLKDLSELQAFMAKHPRGYFLAEWRRFEGLRYVAEDVAWVQQHMRRIDEACSKDVTVYAWGM